MARRPRGCARAHRLRGGAVARRGDPVYSATCENSVSELLGDFVEDRKPRDEVAAAALSGILSGTRWEVGTVTVEGSHSTNFYRVSAREALQSLIEKWGGELSTTIEVEGCEVVSRKVDLTRRGRDNGRRFTYSRDMTKVSRTFCASSVVTAMYGSGKGEEVGDGYGRGINFSDVNGGRPTSRTPTPSRSWAGPTGTAARPTSSASSRTRTAPTSMSSSARPRKPSRKRARRRSPTRPACWRSRSTGTTCSGVALGDDIALVDAAMSPRSASREGSPASSATWPTRGARPT